ncbi:MAG: response regulator, partial [Gammaproteobacteria bacterium]
MHVVYPLSADSRADIVQHLIELSDDDRRLRELLSRFLNRHGYRVTTAASAAEARAKTESVVFDALVLDVMMPG